MIYVRFHPDNMHLHRETCGFKMWDSTLKPCAEKAIGYSGRNIDKRVYLCKEHFEYSHKMAGVHYLDVKTEKRKVAKHDG